MEIYWAPRSAVHFGFLGLRDVDIRPPAPLALSHIVTWTFFNAIFSEAKAAVAAPVIPPPITNLKKDQIRYVFYTKYVVGFLKIYV